MNDLALATLAAIAAGALVALLTPPDPLGRLAPLDGPTRAPTWGAVSGALAVPIRAAVGAGAALSEGLILAGLWPPLVLLSPAVGLGVFWGLGRFPSAAEARQLELLSRDLPEACTLLAVCAEAGLPLRIGLGAVASAIGEPLSSELRLIAARVALGMSDADAWREAEGHAVVGPLARVLARAADHGVALSGLLRDQAREARRDSQTAAVARARQVGVRSVVPLMACFLPAFFLIGVVPVVGSVLSGLLR